MSTEPIMRLAVVVIAALMALATVAFAPQATAQNASPEPASWMKVKKVKKNGTVVFKAPTARVYGRAGDGVAVIANADLYDVCYDRPPAKKTGLLLFADDGSLIIKTPQKGVKVQVNAYKSDVDIFEFFGANCGAFFENGTPLPAPVAVGIGVLKLKDSNVTDLESELQPVGRYENGVSATMADADGELWNLETFVDYEITDPEAPPTFFEDTLTFEPAS